MRPPNYPRPLANNIPQNHKPISITTQQPPVPSYKTNDMNLRLVTTEDIKRLRRRKRRCLNSRHIGVTPVDAASRSRMLLKLDVTPVPLLFSRTSPLFLITDHSLHNHIHPVISFRQTLLHNGPILKTRWILSA